MNSALSGWFLCLTREMTFYFFFLSNPEPRPRSVYLLLWGVFLVQALRGSWMHRDDVCHMLFLQTWSLHSLLLSEMELVIYESLEFSPGLSLGDGHSTGRKIMWSTLDTRVKSYYFPNSTDHLSFFYLLLTFT
jgi:hypothetical protein